MRLLLSQRTQAWVAVPGSEVSPCCCGWSSPLPPRSVADVTEGQWEAGGGGHCRTDSSSQPVLPASRLRSRLPVFRGARQHLRSAESDVFHWGVGFYTRGCNPWSLLLSLTDSASWAWATNSHWRERVQSSRTEGGFKEKQLACKSQGVSVSVNYLMICLAKRYDLTIELIMSASSKD